jgi:hypothetical protein
MRAVVIGQLLDLFASFDLFEQAALDAFTEVANQRPRMDARVPAAQAS